MGQTPCEWTDDPITPDLPIRTVHLNEIRTCLDQILMRLGDVPNVTVGTAVTLTAGVQEWDVPPDTWTGGTSYHGWVHPHRFPNPLYGSIDGPVDFRHGTGARSRLLAIVMVVDHGRPDIASPWVSTPTRLEIRIQGDPLPVGTRVAFDGAEYRVGQPVMDGGHAYHLQPRDGTSIWRIGQAVAVTVGH